MPATSAAQERLMQAAANTPGGFGGVPQEVGKEFVGDETPIEPQAGRSAGILFKTRDGEMLFMHRGDGGDFPRTWGFPGGHTEGEETQEQAARREALEETGLNYEGPLRQIHDDGQFATFLACIEEKFPVTLCDESTGYTWATRNTLPQPAHPGTAAAICIAHAETETDIAQLMADGLMPSPQKIGNTVLFALRITGTGVAFRSKLQEYVYRDPALYLTDEFMARCNGLPVIWEHPDSNILDTKSFSETVIGAIVKPYCQGEDVWGIARIYDMDAAQEMGRVQLSTSPGVVFAESSGNITITLADGSPMLIEGKPVLLDHLAVCELGVWDKQGPPEGVQLDQPLPEVHTMPEEIKDPKADSAEGTPDIKAMADAMTSIADSIKSLHGRMDSFEKKNEPAEPLKAAADKKADADEEGEKKKPEPKADAEKEKEQEEAKADADPAAYADCQARADSVYAAFGDSAPRPLMGESILAYRTRLARKLQPHSKAWAGVNLSAISDSAAIAVAETQIYADAAAAARTPVDLPNGQMQEIVTTDATGRRISTFRGSPKAWMSEFSAPPQQLVKINKGY